MGYDVRDVTGAEVPRTNRLDRPYEVLSRPCLGRMLDTADKLRAFHAAVIAAKNLAPFAASTTLVACVNWGRWMGNCVCGDAPVIDPEWQLACCLTCGRVYDGSVGAIQMPAEAAEIEAALMQREFPQNRNWNPGDTVPDLLAENLSHGIGG